MSPATFPTGSDTVMRTLPMLKASSALLIGLCAVACNTAQQGGPIEIVYWTGWSGHEFEVQQRLVDEFNRAHPKVRVRLLSQFGNSGYQKVRIAFAGGSTPDVMSTVWADELASYARRGVLTPLDDRLRQSGRDFDKEFVPGLRKGLKVDGKVFALAATTNADLIVYNRKIFREVGIDRVPTTPGELDKAAAACTILKPDGSFERYGFRPTNLRLWAHVFGGEWYDAKARRITADHPRNVAALEWLASYSKRYDISRIQSFQSTFGSESTPNGPFFVGNIAMWATGEWSGEFLRRYAPNLDYGFFSYPAPAGGRPNSTFAGGSVFVIPTACKHKNEAWQFLNWITSPYAVKTFCSEIENVPPLVQVGLDPVFQSNPLMRFAVKLSHSENATGAPGISIWPTYNREIGRAEEAATLGGQNPARVLRDLQVRMEREQARTARELGG